MVMNYNIQRLNNRFLLHISTGTFILYNKQISVRPPQSLVKILRSAAFRGKEAKAVWELWIVFIAMTKAKLLICIFFIFRGQLLIEGLIEQSEHSSLEIIRFAGECHRSFPFYEGCLPWILDEL